MSQLTTVLTSFSPFKICSYMLHSAFAFTVLIATRRLSLYVLILSFMKILHVLSSILARSHQTDKCQYVCVCWKLPSCHGQRYSLHSTARRTSGSYPSLRPGQHCRDDSRKRVHA